MDVIKDWLIKLGLGEAAAAFGVRVLAVVVMLGVACIAYIIAKRFLLRIVKKLVERSKTIWDDILLKRKVFNRFSYFAPALVVYCMAPFVLSGSTAAINTLQLAAKIYMVIVGLLVFDSFLNSVVDIYRTFEFSQKIPIRGFVQGAKIILFVLAGIVILAMIMGKSPVILLGGFGAMMAVFMLIFKDSILGFVAGIQLSANRMIHIGDWIEMPKYSADGDVIDVALTTVKVQNWDKTIATIPTYALISDSFKNWRGMSESGGRRIKRAIYIDMSSVKFCTEQMLEKFKKIKYISEYIERKIEEIREHNLAAGVDESELVNGRHLTNIGTFRAYVVAYLRNHPKIHQEMTFLVRHLEPTPNGLPIQIYVFSNDQVWANYEAIQADIFDHILAVIPKFELRIFQNPTGADLQSLAHPVNA
ncbi:MAG TPA: mechanosensitive ion channel protein MscS [Phycisphaerales bacterium]|nr:mechanosensitive ion channel protein MscS [Phycisphaerales bacterium]